LWYDIGVKIEPRQVETFLKKPDPRIRGIVVYGNDEGLIAERALALARTVCEDLKDPFRVVDIAGDVLKHDPARLAEPVRQAVLAIDPSSKRGGGSILGFTLSSKFSESIIISSCL